MDRNLLSPSSYFGIACVAFSVLAVTRIWTSYAQTQDRILTREKRDVGSAASGPSAAWLKTGRRVPVDSTLIPAGNEAFSSTQHPFEENEPSDNPTVRLLQMIATASKLSRKLQVKNQSGEQRIVLASLSSELALLTTSMYRLQRQLTKDETMFAANSVRGACFDTMVFGLGALFAVLDEQLVTPGREQNGQEDMGQEKTGLAIILQQLRDQRPALNFLLESEECMGLPPTPPSEVENEDVRPKEESTPTGLRSRLDSRAWIEPPPEYSPPGKASLAALVQEKDSISKSDEAPPAIQPVTGNEEYTIDVLYNAVTANDFTLVSDLLTSHGADPDFIFFIVLIVQICRQIRRLN